MKLDEEFEAFVNKSKKEDAVKNDLKTNVKKVVKEAEDFLILHKTKIDFGYNVAKTLTSFATNRTPLALFEGGMNLLNTHLSSKVLFDEPFPEDKGWQDLRIDDKCFDILFNSVLEKYQAERVEIPGTDFKSTAELIKLPLATVGWHKKEDTGIIYYKPKEISEEKLFDFLLNEKLKELNSNLISMDFNNEYNHGLRTYVMEVNLTAEKSPCKDSERSIFYGKYITACLEKGYTRSFIFNGPPGTGKSTLSHTIINNLNFRTLKIKSFNVMDYSALIFIIQKLKIDAIIIDDFDQFGCADEMLEFLESLKSEVKLVIAITNSLQEFHPAVIRPGRFDEIITVDTLEKEMVVQILGPESAAQYYEQVKNWPVAYINELSIRIQIQDSETLEKSIEDLGERVERALRQLQ